MSYIELESAKEYLKQKSCEKKKLLDQKFKIELKIKTGQRWVD